MKILNDLSIRNKLIYLILFICFVVILAGFTILTLFQVSSIKKNMARDIQLNAILIGEYCVVPLYFEDKKGVQDNLEKLQNSPTVVNGVIFNANGTVFAEYYRNEPIKIKYLKEIDSIPVFSKNYIHIFQPIYYKEQFYGTVYLRANTSTLTNEIINSIKILVIILALMTILAFFLAKKMQKFIADPILQLADSAKKISEQADYSFQVTKYGNDEIGELYDSFNAMMGEIHSHIMERDKALDELRVSEERYKSIFKNSRTINFLLDPESARIIDANETAGEFYGYTVEEMINMEYTKLSLKDRNLLLEHMKLARDRKRNYFVAQHKKADGEKCTVEVYSGPIIIDNRPLLFSIVHDITEKKRLEEQLLQSQKMESIGRLAGGIAHDFNNILTGIMGYSELLKLQFPDTSKPEGMAADVIYRNAERASSLTRQLLGFARKGKYNPEPLDLNDLIKETLRVSEKIFDKQITVELDLDESIAPVIADRNQIDQVLTNLMINAKDAMPGDGVIRFKTESVHIEKEETGIFSEFETGTYLKCSISDTGTGIPKNILHRIFDPFFTTKKEGKGTGLGLATVYGIIRNHKGKINVYSEPGAGTTFSLYLPVSASIVKSISNKNNIEKGSETILVVDDESDVLSYSRAMLEKLGYQVYLVTSGIEAIETYKDKKNEIDLIMLDMIMPELNGRETFAKLKEIDPDVAVLLVSGYSQDSMAGEIMNNGAYGFIQKPFRISEISKEIKNVLAEKESGRRTRF